MLLDFVAREGFAELILHEVPICFQEVEGDLSGSCSGPRRGGHLVTPHGAGPEEDPSPSQEPAAREAPAGMLPAAIGDVLLVGVMECLVSGLQIGAAIPGRAPSSRPKNMFSGDCLNVSS